MDFISEHFDHFVVLAKFMISNRNVLNHSMFLSRFVPAFQMVFLILVLLSAVLPHLIGLLC